MSRTLRWALLVGGLFTASGFAGVPLLNPG